MQLTVVVDKKIAHPILRGSVESRTRFALTRLSPQLESVCVRVRPEGLREGGEIGCAISAKFIQGGMVYINSKAAHPQAAVALALERARRCVFRELDRRARASAKPIVDERGELATPNP